MEATLDPLVSEFETAEKAKAYDEWFRTKVQRAIENPAPRIPHDAAMAQLDRMLQERRKLRAGG